MWLAIAGRLQRLTLGEVKETLEGLKKEGSPGVLTRENARIGESQAHGGAVATPGWNAGTGLKGWLAAFVPEIHYKTAMRFMDAGRYALEKYRSDGRFLQRSCGLRKDSTENE